MNQPEGSGASQPGVPRRRVLAGLADGRTAGIRQFLDVGSGLPTAHNAHQAAQSLAPESRIVYADNDPAVLSHARALLTSSSQGTCDYVDSDLRDTATIITHAAPACRKSLQAWAGPREAE